MSVVLITGSGSGIGNLTASALAGCGHTVYASVRSLANHDAQAAREMSEKARREAVDLHVIELDVQSEASADAAVESILEQTGQLDVVVHNAGHLYLGYMEAFSAEELAQAFDINVIGAHRVNRAALPHMRERRTGTLVYVGSTTSVCVPPFLGPYVPSKFALDALAQVTAYEASQFGIETTIVMPGPFMQGTQHFQDASHASDVAVLRAYSPLDPLAAENERATTRLFSPESDAHPISVAQEIARILGLPVGEKPQRTVVDFTDSGVEEVNTVNQAASDDFIRRMGFDRLLHPQTSP